MINRFKIILLLAVSSSVNAYAQVSLPVPVNIQASYTKGTRSVTGEPGTKYWQNHADYSLKINFDPRSRLLNGTVSVDYINNSPDTLKEVDFKLYPNLYKKGSVRNMPVLPADVSDGVRIKQLSINRQRQDEKQWAIDGTNMTVKTPAILPKQSIHFDISYSYTLNKTSHIRTGQVDSGAFFIAYFFPRIAVYDDIDGWNQQHYQGIQEFYNDFCHFNAEITVPGNYEVWATGNLKNAEEILKDKFVKRLTDAARDDKITDIFTEDDLKAGNITANKTANTWKFEADSVTDFTFAISNHYLWKSGSLVVDPATGRRTRVDAVFNQHHEDYFEVINYARKTVEAMSYQFPKWPYPYPHETVFDGLDQMEYPMMVNDNPETKA
ncbi:MAG: peptidase, partial [Mucilaginibacter sp.]|nr:peptidase [Mucilaginibacter sp.]